MRWLNDNVRRWEVMVCMAVILLAYLHVVSSIGKTVQAEVNQAVTDKIQEDVRQAVKVEVGGHIEELKESVDDLKVLLEEFKKINIIQENHQHVVVPDREAELRHQRIRERYVQKMGEAE